MTGKISFSWVLATALCLSSCGGSMTSQYEDPPAAAPSGLSYADPNLFIMGTPIPPLIPTIAGGKPSSYSVEPELPAGLTMDGDGRITGTPTEPKSPETYLVTASNAAGSSLFGIRITILGRFTVGGLVSGLTGTGLVLTNNGGDNLAINANGSFVFSMTQPAASGYAVAVATQPTGQTCTVTDGTGVLTNENYNGVLVDCTGTMNKAARFGDVIGTAAVVQDVNCFYPPSAESPRGYIVDEAGFITLLGDLAYVFGEAPDVPLVTGCGLDLVIEDAGGPWIHVTSEQTRTTYVYSILVTRTARSE